MKTSRYTEAQILAILRQAEGSVPVAELCRAWDNVRYPKRTLSHTFQTRQSSQSGRLAVHWLNTFRCQAIGQIEIFNKQEFIPHVNCNSIIDDI